VRRSEEALVAALDDPPTRAAVEAERASVAELGGGCSVPVAAYAWHEDGELRLRRWAAA
jgi:hydroxymethylbilane synthase